MPLSLLELNNSYPPIWLQTYSEDKTLGGDPVSVDGELNPDITPVSDENSALRKTSGHDYNNHWIRQRVEGDLFHRDNIIAFYIDEIINYLGQRSGLLFNLPDTIIAPERYVVIGQIGNAQTLSDRYTSLFVSAARCVKSTDSGNCGIRIVGTVSAVETVLYTAPATGTNMFTTTGELIGTSRGYEILPTATNVRVEAFNDHASSNAQLSGFVALAPNTV